MLTIFDMLRGKSNGWMPWSRLSHCTVGSSVPRSRMLLSFWAVFIFIASTLSSENMAQPKELIVDVLELPASCDVKAATGDKISIHYVRFFVQNSCSGK